MMDSLLQPLMAVLIYPGALLSLGLSLLAGRVLMGGGSGGRALGGLGVALRDRGGLPYAIAVALGLIALSLLPWPPISGAGFAQRDAWLLWSVVEAGSLLALLPGLLQPSVVARPALRAVQLGISGRLPIWVALGVISQIGGRAMLPPTAAQVLAALATLLALPAAAGMPPFGPGMFDSGIGSADESVLDDRQAALLRWARRLHAIFWLALVATVYLPLPALQWWVDLLLRLLVVIALAALVRASRGLAVNRTLPSALRWCWWVALPCAVAALFLV